MTEKVERAVGWGRERKQHAGYYQKVLFRKRMLRWAVPGAVYIPFCGDADIAVELYHGTFAPILGADLEPERVETAQRRLTDDDIRLANVNTYPFVDRPEAVTLGDFDAWADPYTAFRSFWELAPTKGKRIVLFFTDGMRIPMMADGYWTKPDGTKERLESISERQPVFYKYLNNYVWPWFNKYVRPYEVIERYRYTRGQMVYWAAAIERRR